jgi:hypothetical protein
MGGVVVIDMNWAYEIVDDDAVTWDGCEAAIIGVASRCSDKTLFVYDYNKLVEVFIGQGMTEEEAIEWVDYNIANAWVGDGTPYIMYTNG